MDEFFYKWININRYNLRIRKGFLTMNSKSSLKLSIKLTNIQLQMTKINFKHKVQRQKYLQLTSQRVLVYCFQNGGHFFRKTGKGKEMQLTLKQMTTHIVWRRGLSHITHGNEKWRGIGNYPMQYIYTLGILGKCNPKCGKIYKPYIHYNTICNGEIL